jgi:hypothetical protein
MFNQFLNQNKSIFSIFAVLSLLTVAGVSIYNNGNSATDTEFQAQTAIMSQQQQFDTIAEFYNPAKFDAKWNAYKPTLIKEITDLYANGTFKKPLDVNGFRRGFYVVASTGGTARGFLFTPTEYTCFFNNLSTSLDALDCPLQKTGKFSGTVNFYARLPKDSALRAKSDNLLRTYSDWYYKTVTPTLKTLGTKLGKI